MWFGDTPEVLPLPNSDLIDVLAKIRLARMNDIIDEEEL